MWEFLKPKVPPNSELTLLVKYGFDGFRLESWNQKSSDSNSECESALASGMVPLKLYDVQNTVWKNCRPNSPKFFRHVRIQFIKEDIDALKQEAAYFEEKIENLHDVIVDNCKVNFKFVLSMLDGKVSKRTVI